MKGLQDQVYCLVFPLNLLVKYLKYFIKFYTHKSLKICGPARSDRTLDGEIIVKSTSYGHGTATCGEFPRFGIWRRRRSAGLARSIMPCVGVYLCGVK